MRKTILLAAVDSDMKEAVEKAVSLFNQLRKDGKFVSPNMRWLVYSTGVRQGDQDDWSFAWKHYTESQIPSEQR